MRRPWIPASLVLAAGLVAGGWFLSRAARVQPGPEPTRLFQQVFNHVRRYGVDSLPDAELYRMAADGLLRQLDDEFAALVPAGSAVEPEPDDPGGLGMLLSTRNGRATVIGLVPGGPAARSGIEPGDLLIEAAGSPLDPSRRDLLLAALAGPPGTELALRIRRPTIAPLAEFRLVRGRPVTSAVSPGVLLPGRIGYLAVSLPGRGAATAVEEALSRLVKQEAAGLVLDLRGASGGDLAEAADIASLFLEKGALIATARGKSPEPREIRTRRAGPYPSLPLVVLVDSLTADAGEVIAGALQDHDRAPVAGQVTFGRGFSRDSYTLAADVTVRISTESWHTPAGRPIPRDTAFAPDSLAGRPTVTSAGGRNLIAGGGIVPDSIVPADTLTEATREFLRGVGRALAEYSAAIHAVATDVVRASAPGDEYQPGGEEVDRVVSRLRETGVVLTDEVVVAARADIARRVGDEVARASGGEAALLRRRVERDRTFAMAVALLHGVGPSPN